MAGESVDPVVQRTRHARGRHAGEATLAQTFVFPRGVTAAAIGEVLRSASLVGADSIFGDRPGEEVPAEAGTRHLHGFSPVPGFRFDVEVTEREPGVLVASFAQPDRRTPYLQGDAMWLLSDGAAEGAGAVFEEEINTGRARVAKATPLSGPRPSLRRWLFFRVGHAQVMRDAANRIARLAGAG